MNNLLCSILLFCVTKLILADADCLPYPHIPYSEFNEDCGLVTITCKKGFVMHSLMECIDGEWEYTKPECMLQDCEYNIINNMAIFPIVSSLVQNQAECDKECIKDARCTTALFDAACYLYGAPIVSKSLVTDLNQCIENCKQMIECVLLSYTVDFNLCLLCNDTLNNVPDNIKGETENAYDTIAEKVCL